MSKFKIVALGGTFDIIHKGHVELLTKGFSVSKKVIIGLTSDEFSLKKGKRPLHEYDKRLAILQAFLDKTFPNSEYEIYKLENDFGPAVLKREVEALVVSEETQDQGEVLNKLRAKKNLPHVVILKIPMLLAKDGQRISTTRIRNSEIDEAGNLCRVDN